MRGIDYEPARPLSEAELRFTAAGVRVRPCSSAGTDSSEDSARDSQLDFLFGDGHYGFWYRRDGKHSRVLASRVVQRVDSGTKY